MEHSLIDALLTLSSLQRWNFLPRIEAWTETENIAYITHVAYVLGRATGENDEILEPLLLRLVLKSFNKHLLSDIPVSTREELKSRNSVHWVNVINDAAKISSNLFPKNISEFAFAFLSHDGDYKVDPKQKSKIETLIKYVQNKVALEECETNAKIYPSHYERIVSNIKEKISGLENSKKYDALFDKYKEFFIVIKQLKYLRRWNRTNRSVETTVLSHTFDVAFLSLLFSKLCEHEIEHHVDPKDKGAFLYKAILKALYHDIPEALTGDLITPVKKFIQKYDPSALTEIEDKLVARDIISKAPDGVQKDIETYHLLEDLKKNSHPYSINSLVKACDKLALVLECVYEKSLGSISEEMTIAYKSNVNDLLNSEWQSVREFCIRLLLEFPIKD